MKIKLAKSVGVFVLAVSVFLGLTASADDSNIEYDQDVTPDVIFGSGNSNGFFTTDRRNGIELGLRAKVRFPTPEEPNSINMISGGDGTYRLPVGDACPGFGFSPTCLSTPLWSFDWSVNSDYDTGNSTGKTVGDFTYELKLDADPGKKKKDTKFDPITPNLVAPAFDHAMGDNGGFLDGNPVNYVTNLTSMNVAQNSWNYEFFNDIGTSLGQLFNPAVDGNYVISLKAKDKVTGETVAETKIQVLVGNAEKLKSKKSKKSKK